jgi:hypothetical protein
VVGDTHFNALLLAPAAAVRMAQRRRGTHSRSDLALTPPALDRLLELPLRVESRVVAAGGRLPAGLSLLAVLRRPAVPRRFARGTAGSGAWSACRGEPERDRGRPGRGDGEPSALGVSERLGE